MKFNEASLFQEVKFWKRPFHQLIHKLAHLYLKFLPNVQVIGITGSVGKTLTQNAIFAVLSEKYKVVVGEENLDPTFRIPRTIFSLKPSDQIAILEYGVEHPGEMDYYLAIVRPDITVVTTVAPTHIKYFKSVDGVLKEKSKLVSGIKKGGIAILNEDDPYVSKMEKVARCKIEFFGQKSKDGVKFSDFTQSFDHSEFTLHYQGKRAKVSWPIIGEHQVTSALAAAQIGLIKNMGLTEVVKGLSKTKTPIHRLNPVKTKNFWILDDTYNASPVAMSMSLETLFRIKKNFKIAVLGEMKDLGSISVWEHKKIGYQVAQSSLDVLVTIGDRAKIIGDEARSLKFKGKIYNVDSTLEAVKIARKFSKSTPLVLVKGSRHAHLERVVNGLSGKSMSIRCYHCGDLS